MWKKVCTKHLLYNDYSVSMHGSCVEVLQIELQLHF